MVVPIVVVVIVILVVLVVASNVNGDRTRARSRGSTIIPKYLALETHSVALENTRSHSRRVIMMLPKSTDSRHTQHLYTMTLHTSLSTH